MFPKNNASPERIAVGAVVLIADGTVQTSGVSITVVPQGGSTAAGGGTTTYEQGIVFYVPTQAETNYTSFIVTAYKASCLPVALTIVTTAAATAGQVRLEGVTHTSAVIPTVSTLTDKSGYSLTQAFPPNFANTVISVGGRVDSLVQGYLNTSLTETTAGRIAGNFDTFFENADAATTKTVDAVGGGSADWTTTERNEIRGRLGITGTTAAGGNTPTLSLQATIDLVKTETDKIQTVLADTNELQTNQGNWLTAAGFATETKQDAQDLIITETRLAELDAGNLPATTDSILVDTNELQVDWTNGGRLDNVLDARMAEASINTTGGAVDSVTLTATTTTNTDMRGTDGANTTVPDAAGVVPTAIENRQEMDSNSVQLNTTIPALIDDLGIKKNAAFSNFEFLMVLSSDHVTPATGLTVTGQRSINGGSFAAASGVIAEVSNGIYQFDALAADTNGDLITWRFLSATADDAFITFKTVA